MKLYHGSNTAIARIDLARCKPYKDFGQGFYLTEIEEQAVQMARRTAAIYGGTGRYSFRVRRGSGDGRRRTIRQTLR